MIAAVPLSSWCRPCRFLPFPAHLCCGHLQLTTAASSTDSLLCSGNIAVIAVVFRSRLWWPCYFPAFSFLVAACSLLGSPAAADGWGCSNRTRASPCYDESVNNTRMLIPACSSSSLYLSRRRPFCRCIFFHPRLATGSLRAVKPPTAGLTAVVHLLLHAPGRGGHGGGSLLSHAVGERTRVCQPLRCFGPSGHHGG